MKVQIQVYSSIRRYIYMQANPTIQRKTLGFYPYYYDNTLSALLRLRQNVGGLFKSGLTHLELLSFIEFIPGITYSGKSRDLLLNFWRNV